MKKIIIALLVLVMVGSFIFTNTNTQFVDIDDLGMIALASVPSGNYTGVHPGLKSRKSNNCEIDYSNISDGYVMVNYKVNCSQKLKVQVKGPTTTYTYNITPKSWTTLSLSDGNGKYTVVVYKNVSGTRYSKECTVTFTATMTNPNKPFLMSNQYVNFENAINTIAKADELTMDMETDLEKVKAIYNYVINNLTYDKVLASTVQSGYLPDLDKVLEKKKGICFDYAALMAGMLRSQGIPCKLVVGYAGTAYHAWINVYTEEQGWVDNAIYFDGKKWGRMDPTFASVGKKSKAIMKYIGDGANYKEKYLY